MSLVSSNSHPRDRLIKFNKSRHAYATDKCPYLRSITKIVSDQFPRFDHDKVISKMKGSDNWETSKYYGMSNKEIKSLWNKNARESREEGTKLHDMIEKYCNGYEIEVYEEDTALNQFLEWAESNELNPYRTEWRIFDDDLKIAGTPDAVFENEKGEFVLIDWKRCKEIKKNNRFDCSVHPELKHLPDCNFVKYSLQLNLYKYILEKNYGMKISKMLILNMHPDQSSFEEIEALDLEKEVSIILGLRQSRDVELTPETGIRITGTLYLSK